MSLSRWNRKSADQSRLPSPGSLAVAAVVRPSVRFTRNVMSLGYSIPNRPEGQASSLGYAIEWPRIGVIGHITSILPQGLQ
jgi:hypothetical protein